MGKTTINERKGQLKRVRTKAWDATDEREYEVQANAYRRLVISRGVRQLADVLSQARKSQARTPAPELPPEQHVRCERWREVDLRQHPEGGYSAFLEWKDWFIEKLNRDCFVAVYEGIGDTDGPRTYVLVCSELSEINTRERRPATRLSCTVSYRHSVAWEGGLVVAATGFEWHQPAPGASR